MGEKVIGQDFDFFAYSAEETFGLLRLDQTLPGPRAGKRLPR